MFDANYFRSTLQRDVEATGGEPVVEVLLLNGHMHRLRSIVDAADGRVTVEAYQTRGDLAHLRFRFGDKDRVEQDTFRAVIAYESIAAIVLDPSTDHVKARPGF